MKFMNQARFYGRMYREEGGEGGEGEGGADGGQQQQGGGEDKTAAQLAELQAENERLQAKIAEANKHNKEAERKAKEEARQRAEAEGNYQQLYESSEKERQTLQQQLEDYEHRNAAEKVNNEALRLAGQMADGPNAEILADYIAKRLKFSEGGIKVTDTNGNLTVSTLDDLKAEFEGSARFASLIKGNQSSGGGAAGGSGGGSATQTMRRADFDQLDPVAKSKFTKDGGRIID